MTTFEHYSSKTMASLNRISSVTNNFDADICDKYDNTSKRIRFTDAQHCNNYEAIGNESQSIYAVNNYSLPSEYNTNTLDKENNYLQAQVPSNRLRQSFTSVSTAAYNSSKASLISPENKQQQQHILLGNENYVISIQPMKLKNGKSLCDESETDNTRVTLDETQVTNSQQTILKKPKSDDTQSQRDSDDASSHAESDDSPKVSYICFFCRCFCGILSFFCKCVSCCGGGICTPCFGAAMFGAVAAGLAVICMGFFGIIPIPMNWTESICSERVLLGNHSYFNPNYTQFFNITSQAQSPTRPVTSTKNTSVPIVTQSRLQFIQNKQKLELEKRLNEALECEKTFDELNCEWLASRYSIVLLPYFNDLSADDANFQQEGSGQLEMKINLEIDLVCNQSSKLIRIETRDFSNINITIENDLNIFVIDWSYDPFMNLLNVNLNKECSPKSRYKLTIFILYKNYGLSYEEKSIRSLQKYYLANLNSIKQSPFPILAQRAASNCSSMSSIFNLTLVKLPFESHQLIFNMDVSSSFTRNSLQFVNYKVTPFMRVKSIALSVGKFNCRENKFSETREDLLKIRLCTLVLFNDQMERVLSYTRSIIEFYRNYTGREYPLSKLDILVLPSMPDTDKSEYAHLGLVYLPLKIINQMYDSDELTRAQVKSKIIFSIARQLAKHWFDGLSDCSCSLWTHPNSQLEDPFKALSTSVNLSKSLNYTTNCFLQNGLSTWLSYMSIQLLQPELYDLLELEWYMLRKMEIKSFSVYQSPTYFYFDYNFVKLTSSQNIIQSKIELKSLMITKTLFLLFGPQKFQMILNRLFKKSDMLFENSSIELGEMFKRTKREESFVDILELFSKQYNLMQSIDKLSLKNVILSWILSENDMVLSINRNYNKRQALVALDLIKSKNFYCYPFIWSKFELKSETNELTTEVGLSKDISLKNDNSNLLWLRSSINSPSDLPGADKFIIGNYLRAFGSFRVNYDTQNWALMTDQLKRNHNLFNLFDRNQIIDDSFYLSNYGRLTITVALDLLEYLPHERYYLPWKLAIDNLKHLISYIQDDSSTYGVLREYIIRLFESVYKRLKWGESLVDTLDEKLIRILVVDLMCMLDYEECVENSVKQLSDNIRINVNNIPQHLSNSVLCTAIRYTGIKEWDYLWSLYSSQPLMQRNHALLLSLSCSSQIWILNLLLQRLVYENYLPKQDLPIAFEYISQNPIGKYIAWNHISQNYQKFYNQIGNDPELFVKLIEISTRQFKFKYEVKQVFDFMQSIGIANLTATIDEKNIYQKIDSRINMYSNWNNWNLRDMNEWLIKKLKKLKQL